MLAQTWTSTNWSVMSSELCALIAQLKLHFNIAFPLEMSYNLALIELHLGAWYRRLCVSVFNMLSPC